MIGIYLIRNLINGKLYFGQSWNVEKRISQYKKLQCPNKHLLKEFKKYGIGNFRFELVKKIVENENTQKMLDESEDYFIQHYNTTDVDIGYNKKKGGKYKIDD